MVILIEPLGIDRIGTAKAKQFSAFYGKLYLAILIGFHITGIIRDHCLDIDNFSHRYLFLFRH